MDEKKVNYTTTPNIDRVEKMNIEMRKFVLTKIAIGENFWWKIILMKESDETTNEIDLDYEPSIWDFIEFSLDELVKEGILRKIERGKYKRIK
ncbi:MAG: hypothetical protein GPJ52_00080 [Candidatus Heimdallarchaeota archaeon]|nr:hypothetical protein [Candidatus Heimdallarchaeota archaeon]